MRVAVIWHRFGPYHLARLNAAAQHGKIVGIEFTRNDAEYGWNPDDRKVSFSRHSLSERETDCSQSELQRRLARCLDSVKPDSVFIPGYGTSLARNALLWSLHNNVPAVLMSDSNSWDSRRLWHKELAKSKIISCFSAALAAGTPQADYLKDLGFPADRITLGYNAVDNDYFSTNCNRLRATSTPSDHQLPERYLLVVTRLVEKKNLSRLILAYKLYCHNNMQPLPLVIAGDGPLRFQLTQQLDDLSLSNNVHMPGFVEYDQLPYYYAFADLCILPSLVEQWGLVINEAMASGIIVALSDRCGCATDLIEDGITGFRFNPTSITDIAEAIERAVSHAGRDKIINNASDRINQWGLSRFVSGFWHAADIAYNSKPVNRFIGKQILRLSRIFAQ